MHPVLIEVVSATILYPYLPQYFNSRKNFRVQRFYFIYYHFSRNTSIKSFYFYQGVSSRILFVEDTSKCIYPCCSQFFHQIPIGYILLLQGLHGKTLNHLFSNVISHAIQLLNLLCTCCFYLYHS